MDLKLKDKITKLLIEFPGLSVSEVAKQTKTHYSYVHKIIAEMEKNKQIVVERSIKGKKEITSCRISKNYKQTWAIQLRTFLSSQLKDAEIKASFMIMYIVLALISFQSFKTLQVMVYGFSPGSRSCA